MFCVEVVSYVYIYLFFFFKQKTAYEMRISDWSSDVCSSDLRLAAVGIRAAEFLGRDHFAGRGLYQRRAGEEDRALVADDDAFVGHGGHIRAAGGEIGRASCRERVWPYG